MSSWKFLKKGDVIDVVAPGYPSKPHEVEGAHLFLQKWGLQPRIPADLIKPHFLHANEDEQRFAFLKAAIEAKDSQVIWCLRGGYGSNRLLPYLARLKKPAKPKLVIGISDVTSLHTFFINEWGWKPLHAPLLDRLGRNLVAPKYEKELHKILFGQSTEVEFKNLRPLNEAARKVRNIKAKVVGGNLRVLESALGTPWQIETRKKLLFLEDIGERGYSVDRMLEHFRQCGLFKNCEGIVLGDFIGSNEPNSEESKLDLVIKRWALDLQIPLFSGMQAGHGTIQRPVPFNTECELVMGSNKKAILSLATGGRK